MNLSQINYCADVFRNLRDGDERMAQNACCYLGVRFDVAKQVFAEFVAEGGLGAEEPFSSFKEKMERAFWSLFHFGEGRDFMNTPRERNNVIVAGSRTFEDYPLLKRTLESIFAEWGTPTAIICGEARGADSLGRRYAQECDIPVASFPADWKKRGVSAGYIRNAEMLKVADGLVAFWDGTSKGTTHMIGISRKAGIRVRVVKF